MTYEQFIEKGKEYDVKMSEQEAIMNKFPRTGCGLVTEDVRLNPEYQLARKTFQLLFRGYRALNHNNKAHVKQAAKERYAARLQRVTIK